MPSTPVVARRRMTTPVVAPRSGLNPSTLTPSCSHSRACERIPQTKNPSCRHSVAACVPDHSRGQALAPATALRTNENNTPLIVIPESPPQEGLAFPPELQGNSFTPSPVVNTCSRNSSQSNRKTIPQTKNPSCSRSTGGCGWLAGPPANTCPRNKPSKQTATTPPHKTTKTKSALILACPAAGRGRVAPAA